MRYWQRRLRKFMKERVMSDWRYKIAAIAAAFVVWAYVAGQQSMQAVFKVPVYFQNLPENLEMRSQKLNAIQVTVAGRRDRMLSLKERQIWVSIDLGGMKKGRNYYTVKRADVVVPSGIEVKSYTPKKILIRLNKEPKKEEKKQEKKEEKKEIKKKESSDTDKKSSDKIPSNKSK